MIDDRINVQTIYAPHGMYTRIGDGPWAFTPYLTDKPPFVIFRPEEPSK